MDSIEKLNLLVFPSATTKMPHRHGPDGTTAEPGVKRTGSQIDRWAQVYHCSWHDMSRTCLGHVECSILAVDPRVSQFTKTYGDKGNFIWSAGKLLGKIV